jgi:uncharacterized membrane protein
VNKDSYTDFLPKERLLALSDGVFAIVMTLLVLEIKLPDVVSRFDEPHLIETLIKLAPKLQIYVITFISIGVFWIVHHFDFHFIKHVDRQFIWTNIILLLFITFIPFSSDLIGEHPDCHIASLIFGLNMLIIWMIIFASWRYATHDHRLVDEDLNIEFIRYISRRNLLISMAFLISIIISIISIRTGVISYLLIPVTVRLYGLKFGKMPKLMLDNPEEQKIS